MQEKVANLIFEVLSSLNEELVRAFCKDKLAAFKIPSKVEVVDSLAISERFKKVRMK